MFDDCSFGTSTGSVAVFRYGFDRLSHRGKTAPILATLKFVKHSGGSMAVAIAVAELAEAAEATII